MTTYLPGSFGVVSVPGPGGWWIGVAQALAGDASRYKHAFLILDEAGTILEAEPGGARLGHVSEYDGDGLLISDAPVQSWLDRIPRPDQDATRDFDERWIRARIVAQAETLVGTPYSFADYAAIGLLHLHLPSKALRRYVESSGHLICSALVDRVYMNVGIHLFDDKPYKHAPNQPRYVGDVMPADLAAWIEDQR